MRVPLVDSDTSSLKLLTEFQRDWDEARREYPGAMVAYTNAVNELNAELEKIKDSSLVGVDAQMQSVHVNCLMAEVTKCKSRLVELYQKAEHDFRVHLAKSFNQLTGERGTSWLEHVPDFDPCGRSRED